jgi:hypothetical protein
MKQRAILGMQACLFLLMVIFFVAACQAPSVPAPVPVVSGVRAAGQGHSATTLSAFSGAVATTTQQTFSAVSGEYASAQVWYQIPMDPVVGITLTVWLSPDNANWAQATVIGPFTATQALTYTLLSDVGRYIKATLDVSATTAVTPTVWLVLKD